MGDEMARGVGGGAFEAGGDMSTFIGTGEESVRCRCAELLEAPLLD